MDKQAITNSILDLCMEKTPTLSLDEVKLTGVKRVNLYVVTSKFDIVETLTGVHISQWRKKYRKVEDDYRCSESPFTLFLIITDTEDDKTALYVNKIK